jgi:hypothetical protein
MTLTRPYAADDDVASLAPYPPERLRAVWARAVRRAHREDADVRDGDFPLLLDARLDFLLLERAALLVVEHRVAAAYERVGAADRDAQALVAVRAMALLRCAGNRAGPAWAAPRDVQDCREVIRALLLDGKESPVVLCARVLASFDTQRAALAAAYEYSEVLTARYGQRAAGDLLVADITQFGLFGALAAACGNRGRARNRSTEQK